MRYYLKINDTEFPNVSALQVTTVYRQEWKQTSLAGGLLLDRMGSGKTQLNVNINMITPEQMTALNAAREALSCTVMYDEGAERQTKTMHLNSFVEPSPIYYYGDKANGIIYGSIALTLEEI